MTKPSEFSYTTTPARVAARVLFSNYWFFVAATLALAGVTWLQLEQLSQELATALHIFSDLLAAIIQVCVAVRLVQFFNPNYAAALQLKIRAVMLGTAITALSSAPAILGALGGIVKLDYLFLTLPAYFVFYFGYFYFAPILWCQGSNARLRVSFAIVKAFPAAPLRVMIPATAISTLLGGLVGLLSPDGREPFYNAGLAVASSLGDTAGFFLAAAYGAWYVSKIPGSTAPTETQFTGSELESTNPTGDMMSLKTASILLLAGIALNFGNFGQSAGMEPATRITLINSTIEGSDVVLELKLADERYLLRGFQPIALALAGPNRGAISLPPELQSFNGEASSNQNLRFQLPRSDEPVSIKLRFKTSRSSSDLAAIEDLHLWYKNVKLFKLDLLPPSQPPDPKPAAGVDGP